MKYTRTNFFRSKNMKILELSGQQKNIMKEFYSLNKYEIYMSKDNRAKLWNKTKNREKLDPSVKKNLEQNCPALAHQVERSYQDGNNIQQAIFSECIYAQALANLFNLNCFHNCYIETNCIDNRIIELISSYHLSPRYMYCNKDKSRMLIQAGSCDGVDSALITVLNLDIYTIEFKERGAKTGEHDLPEYGEDGQIVINDTFLNKYPQFKLMLNDQSKLNFFEVQGHNINDFDYKSVEYAVAESYSMKKYADVICSEDLDKNLIMLPANQLHLWANLQGEIRPCGRNHYSVFTPIALCKFLKDKGAIINDNIVRIKNSELTSKIARGGDGSINRYGINSLFFVYALNCKMDNDYIEFNINDVRQLHPTIAAKMELKSECNWDNIKKEYNL